MSNSDPPLSPSPASPASTLTSLIGSILDSPGFSDTLPEVGTNAFTELNTTVVSDTKLPVPPEEVELGEAVHREDLLSAHGRRRRRSRSRSSTSKSATTRPDDHGSEDSRTRRGRSSSGFTEKPYSTRLSESRSHYRRSSGDPRMSQIPVSRDFFLIIGLCVVLACAVVLLTRPAIFAVYEHPIFE